MSADAQILQAFNSKTVEKYKPFKSSEYPPKSVSLSARASKGSIAPAKQNYTAKHKELFKKFMGMK